MLVIPPAPTGLLARATGVDVADVFSVDTYTGNATDDRNITNGVDLSGEGGTVWIKNRDQADKHIIANSESGPTKYLSSNATTGETTDANMIQAFNSDGFQIGTAAEVNTNAEGYVATSFRKAPGFHDVVTYTGDGTASRVINHDLGATPGMIIVKRTDSAYAWQVYNRGFTSLCGNLNSTAGFSGNAMGAVTDASFTTGTFVANWNTTSATYVAYIFGHDTDGIIQCGAYTGNGSSTGPTITLGWQPQLVLIKNATTTGNWGMYDSARDASNPNTAVIHANATTAETASGPDIDFNATSFQIKSTSADVNTNAETYIYMAIKAED